MISLRFSSKPVIQRNIRGLEQCHGATLNPVPSTSKVVSISIFPWFQRFNNMEHIFEVNYAFPIKESRQYQHQMVSFDQICIDCAIPNKAFY